ncbi:M60 family metallopeptidase [Niabella pedocola]|uniref:M60 family metallopeptidase n=1 Tax=Niabella pedocola TaxID=1752077 RepID=A0ABS8PR87_9BACT|nr:M60 family metallopeptidase [Niabella pedocola]MCD2423385.1 M60 family metallopeptidase [Niabella pedocola]
MKKNNYYLLIICGFVFAWLAGCNKNYGLKFDNGYTGTDFPDTLNVDIDTSVKVDKSKYIQASVFPGLISPDEPRLQNYVVNIDLNYVDVPASALRISVAPGNWLSTGVWAPAGELVTVEVPEGIYGLEAQIGSHTDNLTGKPDLKRDPLIYNRRQLFPGKNYLRNLYGGLIYIIPSKPTGAIVPLSFSGVARSASFFLGKTTDTEWKELVRKTTVPFFELVGKRIVFTLETAKLAQVSINSPDELMRLWDNTIKEVYWNWYGLVEGNPDVKNRAPFNQWRIVHDIQPSVGAQHSGFPVVAMNTMNYFRQAVVPDEVKTQNWGTFHELGHNMQMHSTWTFGGNGEVSNNLFNFKNAQLNNVRHSNELRSWNAALPYVQKDTLSKRWDGTALWPGGTAAPTNPTDDAKMSFYTQIFEKYGYEFMTYLCTAARNARFTAIDEQSKVDFYYERLCEFTQTDMYRFMREWGLTVSQTSKNIIAAKGYPKLRTNLWMYNPYTRTGGDQTIAPKIEFGAGKPGPSLGWTVTRITNVRGGTNGTYNAAYDPANLLDGDLNTIWHSCFNGCYSGTSSTGPAPNNGSTSAALYPFDAVVQTGTDPVTADGFYIVQRQAGGSNYNNHLQSVTIAVSMDGTTWENVVSNYPLIFGNRTDAYPKQYIELPAAKTFRYFKFTWPKPADTNNNSAFAELGAFKY